MSKSGLRPAFGPLLFAAGLAAGLLCGTMAASAEGLSCAAFLQNRDGSWRSFNEADVIGPDGPVHLEVGERLYPSAKSAKGELARALNELCSAH